MKINKEDMHPELLKRYELFCFIASQESQVPFQLNCVLRTELEQKALHAQGRLSIDIVNGLRKQAGMPWMITEAENKNPVTWTLKSKHFADKNGKSRAFDVVVLRDGRKATWDLKWDGDKDNVGDYLELARAGEKAGLISGGLQFGDWPHFQLPDDVL